MKSKSMIDLAMCTVVATVSITSSLDAMANPNHYSEQTPCGAGEDLGEDILLPSYNIGEDSTNPGDGCSGLYNEVLTGVSINNAANISGIVSGFAGNSGSGSSQNNNQTSNERGVQRVALNGDSETGLAGSAGAGSINAWMAYVHSRVDYSFDPLDSDGHSNVGMFGVDYTFANNVVLGVAVTIDRTDIDTNYNNGKLENDGYSIAPYVAWGITPNLTLDASAGWGRADVDQRGDTGGGFTSSTDSSRRFAALGLSYNKDIGDWRLTGKGNLLYAKDDLDSFTDSTGARFSSASTSLTQLRLGGQAMYVTQNFAPYVGLAYVSDLSRDDQDPVLGDRAANDDNSVILQAGVNIYGSGKLSGGLMLQSEQGRSEVDNDQLLANITYSF